MSCSEQIYGRRDTGSEKPLLVSNEWVVTHATLCVKVELMSTHPPTAKFREQGRGKSAAVKAIATHTLDCANGGPVFSSRDQ